MPSRRESHLQEWLFEKTDFRYSVRCCIPPSVVFLHLLSVDFNAANVSPGLLVQSHDVTLDQATPDAGEVEGGCVV